MNQVEVYTLGCVVNAIILAYGFYVMSPKGKRILKELSFGDKVYEVNKTLFMVSLSWAGLIMFAGYQLAKHMDKKSASKRCLKKCSH